jgi:aryl-alcohol dehydrogenase
MEDSMKIKAAVVREKSGPFLIEEMDIDNPRENEILVRIGAVGLCHTDLVARDQDVPLPLPAVLGHEGAGIVEQVGSKVTKVKPGDHVVLSYLTCGTCPSCKQGEPYSCVEFGPGNFIGMRQDGSRTLKKGDDAISASWFSQSSFATYSLATDKNVIKVPDDVPLEILGPLGCGIMTGAGAVFNGFHPKMGSSLAVFGTGAVGMSALLAAVACGCTKVIAVDVVDSRLEMATSFGATHAINGSKVDAAAEIQKITGRGVDYTFDSTGNMKVIAQAVAALTAGGTCGLAALAPFTSELRLPYMTIQPGRNIKGIIMGTVVPEVFIPKMIDLYKVGRFPFDKMISFYPFDQINQAVEDSTKGKALKAVMRM